MPSTRRVEHKGAGTSQDATSRVVIGPFHDVDFFTQLRCLTDDFPRLARGRLVTGYHGETVGVLTQHPPPAAVLLTSVGSNVVAGRFPTAFFGTNTKALPGHAH